MVRNDEDVPVTLVDLRDCGWEAIVQNNSHEGYVSLWQAFSNAAGAAVEKDELRKGKCLRLLANATSMMLSPASVTNPFKPMLLLSDGRRSALPSDFAPEDVKLLTHFLELIDNPWLKARLSDMAWLLLTPRDPRFALIAIEEYMRIPLELEAWIAGGDDCWRRAASIAMMLKRAGEKQLEAIESTVLSAFLRLEVNHGFMAFWLAEFLEKHRLGKAAAYAISERLHAIALALEMQNEFHASRGYFEQAAHWFLMLGDQKSSAQMLAGLAKVWEREGEAALSSETPSNMAASGFYEKAIQSYRRIPRALRDEHEVDKRIAELRFKLNKTGAEALGEMHVVSSDPIDIAEIIDHASNHVKGKSPLDALNALVTVMRQVSVDQLRERSEQRLKKFPLSSLFSRVHFSRDGRVIAKRPGVGFGDNGSDNYAVALHAEMMRDYRMQLGLVTQALILPALDTIRVEHRLRRVDFAALAHNSPIIPADRAAMIGKGLYAGFDNDFVVALHLLVPQIEHLLRYHLKASGVKTTNLDRDGIEHENGMSTLVELPEVEQIFGKDLAFELRALFCDPFGWNIRNELAHGLLTEDDCFSAGSIYAWWFCLRLVFLPFWNSRQQDETSDDEGPMPTGPAQS